MNDSPLGPALCLSLCLLCLALPARADDLDLLQSLDTAMAAAATKEDERADKGKDIPEQLKDNLDLGLRLRGVHWLRTTGDDLLDKDTQDNLGEIKLDYATGFEKDRVRVVTSGWLEGGNQEDTWSGMTEFFTDDDRRRNVWEINEIYAVADAGEVDVTLGRKVLENGVGTLFSPANRYSAMDLNDPLDPRRLGVWQAAADWSPGDTTWTMAVMPFFIAPKTPSVGSRWISGDEWAGIPGYFGVGSSEYENFLQWLYFFSNLSGVDLVSLIESALGISFSGNTPLVDVQYETPDPDDAGQWGWFGRVKTSVGNWDLMGSAFHGPSIYPVLKADVDLSALTATVIVEHPVTDQAAGGFSTTWKELEFHGEALYSQAEDGKDDSWVQSMIGSTWSNQSLVRGLGMHRLDLTMEYVREDIVDRQSADGYFMSSEYARLGRNDVVGRLELALTQDVGLHWMADVLLDNSARLHRFGITWRVAEGLVWTGAVELFDGPMDTYYGRWRNQDRVVTGLEYHF